MDVWTWQAKRSCRDDYLDPRRRAIVYPCSHRFKDCSPQTGAFDPSRDEGMQPQRFAVMWAAREILQRSPHTDVWQERYKLAMQAKRRHSYERCNAEISDRLGPSIKVKIELEGATIEPKFKDPDIVTFDPLTNAWQFIEVKLIQSRDNWQPGQKSSLLLLEAIVPKAVSVLLKVDLQ